MKFSAFSQALAELELVSSRLEMTRILAKLYADLAQEELIPASYLLQGRLTPQYVSLEFNISTKLVQRAMVEYLAKAQDQAGGLNLFGEEVDLDLSEAEKVVSNTYKKVGDLGQTLVEIASAEKSDDLLSILDVFQKLTQIAQDEGSGSQARKVSALAGLLGQVDPVAGKYIIRMVIGKLRLGFSAMTMIDALSWAVVGDKSERTALEAAYNRRADIGRLAATYLPLKTATSAERLAALERVSIELAVPVMPALCQRLNTSQEIIDKLGQVIAEPKYDGMRVQLHIDLQADQPVRVFTRSLDEITPMFPELTAEALGALAATNCILDAEAIGYDSASGQLRPFQETITRRRKHDVSETAAAVPIRFYIFDILWLNDQPTDQEKLRDRKDRITNLISKNEVFYETPFIQTEDPEELRRYHQELLDQKLEGAVIKKLDSGYVSGRKGWAWVKIKEAEGTSGKLADTLDLIVMGYYAGRGKRAQFGLGALLLGTVADTSKEADQPAIKTIAKLGTGMSEEQLVELKRLLDDLAAIDQPAAYDVPAELAPDVWAQPHLVVEVAADEITTSPNHSAGVALRFPRLLKIRPDKTWEQATNLEEISQLR